MVVATYTSPTGGFGRWFSNTGTFQSSFQELSNYNNHRFLTHFEDLGIAPRSDIYSAALRIPRQQGSADILFPGAWDTGDAEFPAKDVPDPDVDSFIEDDTPSWTDGTGSEFFLDVTDLIQHLVNRSDWTITSSVSLILRRGQTGAITSTVRSAVPATLEIDYDDTIELEPRTVLIPLEVSTPDLYADGQAELTPQTLQVPLEIGQPDLRTAQVLNPQTVLIPLALGGPEVCVGEGWATVTDPGVVAAGEEYRDTVEGHPEVEYNDLYRSLNGGNWELIATHVPVNGSFIDRTNLVRGENCYYALAWSSLPSTSRSEVECLTIYDGTEDCPPGAPTSLSAWLSGGNGFSVSARAYVELNIEESDLGVIDRVLHKFSGRSYASEFSGMELGQQVTFTFTLPRQRTTQDGQQVGTYEDWVRLARMEGPHLYRDYQGRRFVCSVSPIETSDLGKGYRQLTITVTRTEERVRV